MGYVFENINPATISGDIGIGVKFPMNYPAVFSNTFTTIEAVKSNIKNLLLTRKGERVMHPNFGSDLLEIIFEPSVSELKEEVQKIITEPISFWISVMHFHNCFGDRLIRSNQNMWAKLFLEEPITRIHNAIIHELLDIFIFS